MATNWVDEILTGATSTGSKTLSLATGNVMSVANSDSESLFTVTSDTTNGGFTSILGIENQEAVLFLGADNADDAADVWEIQATTSGNFKIGNRTGGTGSPTRGNTITNAITIDTSRNITVGVDDTGYDVKFFGATSGQYLLWDESADELVLAGDTKLSFHDAAGGENIIASGDGHLEINAGTTLDITAPTVDVNVATELNIDGNVDLNGTLDVSSTSTLTGLVTATAGVKLGNNTIYASDGGATITLDTSDNVTIAGDLTVSGGDITVNNMTSSGFIKCVGTEGNAAAIELWADEGDDNADKWQIESAADNSLYFYNYTSGSWVSKFSVTSAGIATTTNDHYMGGVLYIGGADSDGTDRTTMFSHGTAKTIIGIDDSADIFIINADNSGAYDGTVANNSFTIDTSSNVGIGGDLTVYGADIVIGSDADGTDRSVVFGHSTLKTIMGIDDSADAFVINTDASFDGTLANNSFSIDASHNIITGGNLTIAGDLTVTGGDIDLSGEASTINLIDNQAAAIQFGSSGSTDTVTISTADGQETLIVDADRVQVNANLGALQLQGTASMTGNATESVLGGLYFKAPTFVCADSGSHTVTRHSYIKLDDFNLSDGSGSMAVTNAFLLEFENNIGAANSCTTNADKTGEAKSGTIKVNVNGTLYHIQLYAD